MRLSATVVLAAVLLVAGCGTRPDDPSGGAAAPPAAFNKTDVMFLQMMVPHHTQGLEIVKLGTERATKEDVKVLAKAIEATQSDEVIRMSGWLKEWKQPAAADDKAHAEHGGMPVTSEKAIAALRRSTGADFDRAFLNLLIAHQDDAVQLARMEAGGGSNPAAKAFAEQVNASRSAQVKQMMGWLGTG